MNALNAIAQSMSIATTEQAEIALYRANIVEYINEQAMVEGKNLLDICGYSYTSKNWGDKLKRQLDKHEYEEGVNYFKSQSPNDGGAGNRGIRTIIHVPMREANHILLAAFTEEGKAARDEAIDMKIDQQDEFESDPLALALQTALKTHKNVLAIQAKQKEQDKLIEGKADREEVDEIKEWIKDQPEPIQVVEIKEGYMPTEDLRRTVAGYMAEKKFKDTLEHNNWPWTYYTAINGKHANHKAKAYKLEKGEHIRLKAEDFFNRIRREAVRETTTLWTHRNVPGRFTIG